MLLALVAVLAGCSVETPAPEEEVVVTPVETTISPKACTTECIHDCWRNHRWYPPALSWGQGCVRLRRRGRRTVPPDVRNAAA
jgi:hypothetical protein